MSFYENSSYWIDFLKIKSKQTKPHTCILIYISFFSLSMIYYIKLLFFSLQLF